MLIKENKIMEKKYKVIETNRDNHSFKKYRIVREFKNLNIYQAEDIYSKLLNNYSVRSGYNNVKIVELNK
jgi:PHP family Zn ribbon phosphoesterase|tara:strand:+ start:5680 stop:5889 length:210 start_codon:yes stop_codon:yes gene_type:complete